MLGPGLFNISINDMFTFITNGSLVNSADDNTISVAGHTRQEVIQTLTSESESAITWFKDNMMEANPAKFQAIMLNDSTNLISLNIGDSIISTEVSVAQ